MKVTFLCCPFLCPNIEEMSKSIKTQSFTLSWNSSKHQTKVKDSKWQLAVPWPMIASSLSNSYWTNLLTRKLKSANGQRLKLCKIIKLFILTLFLILYFYYFRDIWTNLCSHKTFQSERQEMLMDLFQKFSPM